MPPACIHGKFHRKPTYLLKTEHEHCQSLIVLNKTTKPTTLDFTAQEVPTERRDTAQHGFSFEIVVLIIAGS
jgi:hypothetical protein